MSFGVTVQGYVEHYNNIRLNGAIGDGLWGPQLYPERH
jgi:hypothetical protein